MVYIPSYVLGFGSTREEKLEEMATMKHGKHEMPKGMKPKGMMVEEKKSKSGKKKGKPKKK